VADSIFDQVATALESRTSLEKLEARGTLRIALKQAGLDANSVTVDQLRTVIEKLLPGELEARGVDAPAALCEQLSAEAREFEVPAESAADSPESVFARLAGS
jgi:hypothetical protein